MEKIHKQSFYFLHLSHLKYYYFKTDIFSYEIDFQHIESLLEENSYGEI